MDSILPNLERSINNLMHDTRNSSRIHNSDVALPYSSTVDKAPNTIASNSRRVALVPHPDQLRPPDSPPTTLPIDRRTSENTARTPTTKSRSTSPYSTYNT